jgi:hypothetical protein
MLMIGQVSAEKRRLVEIDEQDLKTATIEMGRRKCWSEVAGHMQHVAESADFSVVTQ